MLDNKYFTVTKNLIDSTLASLKIKPPKYSAADQYWLGISLGYLQLTAVDTNSLSKFNFLLFQSFNYTSYAFKFYDDFSYEIRQFDYPVDEIIGNQVSYSGEGDTVGYGESLVVDPVKKILFDQAWKIDIRNFYPAIY